MFNNNSNNQQADSLASEFPSLEGENVTPKISSQNDDGPIPRAFSLQSATFFSARYSFSVTLLHLFALITTALTFLLLFSGGLVTSKGVGMSVPDWPTTYGYNMFAFPLSRWVGGVFYEHTHRLLASGIGFLTVILSVITFLVEKRRWVRRLAFVLLIGVILQGVLGGLRVTLYKDELGIFHAIVAQTFFALLLIFSAVTSRSFFEENWKGDKPAAKLRWLGLTGVVLTYFQLIVAATMRHAHLGLSIPDFPTAYGNFLPDLSEKAVTAINAVRLAQGMMPTTACQIELQLLHRGGALLLMGVVLLLMIRARELLSEKHWVHRWAFTWGILLILQAALGAWTIWSNKAADVATAHMALGALLLGGSMLFTFRLFIANKEKEEIYSDGRNEDYQGQDFNDDAVSFPTVS